MHHYPGFTGVRSGGFLKFTRPWIRPISLPLRWCGGVGYRPHQMHAGAGTGAGMRVRHYRVLRGYVPGAFSNSQAYGSGRYRCHCAGVEVSVTGRTRCMQGLARAPAGIAGHGRCTITGFYGGTFRGLSQIHTPMDQADIAATALVWRCRLQAAPDACRGWHGCRHAGAPHGERHKKALSCLTPVRCRPCICLAGDGCGSFPGGCTPGVIRTPPFTQLQNFSKWLTECLTMG